MDTRTSPFEKLIQHVGIVFENPDEQLIEPSVEDEVVFPLENFGFPPEVIAKRLEEALKATGLDKLRKKHPGELSGGQKQRLAIACALARQPPILILDETTTDLDPVGKSEVFSLLAQLRTTKKLTMIIVEHNTEQLAKFADELIFLKDGKIIREGTPSQFFCDVPFLKKNGVYPPQVSDIFCTSPVTSSSDVLPVTLNDAILLLPKIIDLEEGSYDYSSAISDSFPTTGGVIINAQDVRFTYPDGTQALNGINLEIRKGEFVAIIGNNGSGKTTLINHFVGLLKPTEGNLEVFGMNTKNVSVEELAQKIALVYQNPDHQLFCQTVFEECAYELEHTTDLSEQEIEQRVLEVLKIMNLTERRDEQPFGMGRGLRQRLAVATALVKEPEIIMVDEPTTGQDASQAHGLMRVLTELNRKGKTIIVITHDMNLVSNYVPRSIVLNQGKILLDSNTRDVFSHSELLEKAALTRPQVTELGLLLPQAPVVLRIEELKNILSQYDLQATKQESPLL
jgi:energy-coupling factor transport system ATP-binding protein